MTALILAVLLSGEITSLIQDSQIATLSTDYKGTPFGSLVPYVLDKKGRPVIFASNLAIHTKNLSNNAKCSLMISRINNKNVFNSARITYIGTMYRIPDDEIEEIKEKYLAKYKMAKDLVEFEDFGFIRMEIDKIYWVGGFGDIQWIDMEEYYKFFQP